MKDKFVKKYMRMARFVGSDQNPCLSRGIGAVIVNPEENRVVSTGYNGPAKDVPHADTYEFLKEYVYPQLTDDDKNRICDLSNPNNLLLTASKKFPPIVSIGINADNFAKTYEGCKICPRKLIRAMSGERLELCGCLHGEENAILNAVESLRGYYMFCWCGIPCSYVCSPMIVQKGIKKVYCLTGDDPPGYAGFKSRFLFKKGGVELIELEEEWLLQD